MYRREVLERVRHLLAASRDQPDMCPVTGEWRNAGPRLALRDFIFVVREDQITAAGVDIDLLAERLANHGRALDVPARTALSPGALPGGLARLGRFPECEIAGITLSRLKLFT